MLRGGPWRVGIRHPRERDRLCAVLELDEGAVATSATYERGEHIADPHTGRPPRGVLSVTVDRPGPRDAPTPTPPPRSRWARPARPGRPGSAGYEAMTVLERRAACFAPRRVAA